MVTLPVIVVPDVEPCKFSGRQENSGDYALCKLNARALPTAYAAVADMEDGVTIFRAVVDPDDNQLRTVLQPVLGNNDVVTGKIYSSGPNGQLPLTDENGNHEFPILESFGRAADHVGPKGTAIMHLS